MRPEFCEAGLRASQVTWASPPSPSPAVSPQIEPGSPPHLGLTPSLLLSPSPTFTRGSLSSAPQHPQPFSSAPGGSNWGGKVTLELKSRGCWFSRPLPRRCHLSWAPGTCRQGNNAGGAPPSGAGRATRLRWEMDPIPESAGWVGWGDRGVWYWGSWRLCIMKQKQNGAGEQRQREMGFRRLSMVPKVSSHFQPEPGPLPPQPVPLLLIPLSLRPHRCRGSLIPGSFLVTNPPATLSPPTPSSASSHHSGSSPALALKTRLQPGVPRWHRRASRSAPEPAPAPGLQVGQTGGGGRT